MPKPKAAAAWCAAPPASATTRIYLLHSIWFLDPAFITLPLIHVWTSAIGVSEAAAAVGGATFGNAFTPEYLCVGALKDAALI